MIYDEGEYDRALSRVQGLLFSTSRTEEYIPLILDIEEYEATHYPIDTAPPHEVLQHIVEHSGISDEELSNVLSCTMGEVSLLLDGHMQVTGAQAIALGNRFMVGPELFLAL